MTRAVSRAGRRDGGRFTSPSRTLHAPAPATEPEGTRAAETYALGGVVSDKVASLGQPGVPTTIPDGRRFRIPNTHLMRASVELH